MESIWKQTYRCEERSALDREIKVDTVIIGGGIAGILTAWSAERHDECTGTRPWDCPCHGSRFDCKGDLLDGPHKKEYIANHKRCN